MNFSDIYKLMVSNEQYFDANLKSFNIDIQINEISTKLRYDGIWRKELRFLLNPDEQKDILNGNALSIYYDNDGIRQYQTLNSLSPEEFNIVSRELETKFPSYVEDMIDTYKKLNKYDIIEENGKTYLKYTDKFKNYATKDPVCIELGFTMSHNDNSFILCADPYVSKNITLINSTISCIIGVPNGEVIIENSSIIKLDLTNAGSVKISNCKSPNESITIKGDNINIFNLSGNYNNQNDNLLILHSCDFSEKQNLDNISKTLYYASTGIYVNTHFNYMPDEKNVYKYMDKGCEVEPKVNFKSINSIDKLIDYYFAAKTFSHTNNMQKAIEAIHIMLGEETNITKIANYLDIVAYPVKQDKFVSISKNYISEQVDKLQTLLYKDIRDFEDDFYGGSKLFKAIYEKFEVDKDISSKLKFLKETFFDENMNIINHIEYIGTKKSYNQWIGYQMAIMETTDLLANFKVNGEIVSYVKDSHTEGHWSE